MDNAKLGKFLNGDANDEEFQHYETWLEDAQTTIDEDAVDKADSLVASLRAARAEPSAEEDTSRQLVERIGGVVTQQLISREEIERLLDAPQQADELGRIGKYRVIEFMAAGGMGLVFKAEDAHLGRLVCIKIMHPALALKPDARLRFERESRAAARLRSERIVTLLDIGVQRELPYIVMQLLDGESLRSKLSREGKLTTPLTVHYLTQIAEGLHHAHGMGILHRDIKPDNIWITATGDIKLLDFGLARPLEDSSNLTTTGGLIGTPQYMSPEQIQGKPLDARSDLFSLGVVLFEMLTGTLPFQKTTLFSTMMAITSDTVSLPTLATTSEVAPDLEELLHRLLKKNPDQRLQSAQELMDQLSRLGSSPSAVHLSTPADNARPLTSASSKKIYPAWYVLAGIAGGLLAMLMFLLVMQATDKGTLLVRSNDPQVELRIAQDKVHIKDPLSGKSFEVHIGKTRLPGGVYQLEMNDATSGLTFSSNTIAIRRGETVIVEVELQPTTQAVAATADKSATEQAPHPSIAQESAKVVQENADPSFQPAAREDFARVLASLPSQSMDLKAADRSSEASLPSGPMKLEGIDSWSIDTDSFVDQGAKYNCDQTLVATAGYNTVQIWDKSLKMKHILRTSHLIRQVKFDNKYPNLIAVCSHVVDVTKADHADIDSCELTVWRLATDYAEVIYRIPSQGFQFAWDQGYRLFHDGRDGLAVFRLDENKDYELHIPHEMLVENAISTNGRFLATHHTSNIDVWDLQRGEFAFTSLGNWRVQWNRQGDRAAFFASNRTAFEIWDLERRVIADRVDVYSEPVSRNLTGMETAAIGLESSFQRVAWLSPRGNLSVRNLRNNREDSQLLPNVSTALPKSASLQWDSGTLSIETDRAAYVWTQNKSDVEGTLNEVKPSALLNQKQGVPLNFTHAVGSDKPVLLWHDKVASDRNRNMSGNAHTRQSELYFDAFDIAANQFVHENAFSQARNSNYSNFTVSIASGLLGPPYISDNGRYATASDADNARDGALITFAEADARKKLAGPLAASQWSGMATVWDKHSRFAFIGNARPSFDEQGALQIYDTQIKSLVDPSSVTLPAGKLVEVQRSQHGFVILTRLKSTTAKPDETGVRVFPSKYAGELEVWRVEPIVPRITKAEVATKLLAKLGTVESITATDRHLYVSVFEGRESGDASAAVRKYFRVALDAELGAHVECVTVRAVDELVFSSSGEHCLREARDAEMVRSNDPLSGPRWQITTKGLSTMYYARWSDVAKDLGDLDAFEKPTSKDDEWLRLTEFQRVLTVGQVYDRPGLQWHSLQEVAAWMNSGYLTFFAPESNKLLSMAVSSGLEPLVASDKGWVRVNSHEIQFYEASGKPIGKLVFDPYLENMKPSRPRWKLSDGSLASQSGTAGLAISYQQGNRFYCASVDEFERTRPEITLPRADVISRFESLK